MNRYPFSDIEKKWQDYWKRNKTFRVTEDPSVPRDRRRYILDMFPYPSAAGLHVGHPEGYTATDIYCRFLRMRGYHVLHPMGFDSFGLAAETYAIQTNTHPRTSTEANINRFRQQIQSLGFSYDWDREVATHRADYYRWTQWIFLKLYEQGLAYVDEIPMWYCEALGTVLANEEVINTPEGPRSERGNHPVERRPLRQWMLKITEYAERLLADLDELDWPESIKTMQRNWIGRSEGATIHFPLAESTEHISVFTTRPDTLFGATYMVLAPEHPLVAQITTPAQAAEAERYVEQARLKSDLERTDLAKDKSGAFTGAYATNPATGEKVPVWISDYILMSYGTGAIMAVPAHDTRDWEFAKAYGLAIVKVVADPEKPEASLSEAFTDPGVVVNSGRFNGMSTAECKSAITDWISEMGFGERAVNYKLRDWVFSRQRYWGEPIPLVHCDGGNVVPVPEDALPVTLPEVESYKPAGSGESPLALVEDWIATRCPSDPKQPGRRETNTMPQWAGSCWYYLRYLDPHNSEAFADPDKVTYWMPVDLYVGGTEHAVLHLLYARFWHKVLFDLGLVSTNEPFVRLVNQGMVLGEGGVKMSKSLGNVINPDDIVAEFGADSLRMYEMFMGPLEMAKPWSTNGLAGVHRFLERVWKLEERIAGSSAGASADSPAEDADAGSAPDTLRALHKTIRKVTEDTDRLSFNTAIAQLMIYSNELQKLDAIPAELWEPFVLLLAPYAPHIAEELWERIGHSESLAFHPWPEFDPELVVDEVVELVVQVNGKVRAKLEVEAGLPEDELVAAAREHERIQQLLSGKTLARSVVVPDKLVNFVLAKG